MSRPPDLTKAQLFLDDAWVEEAWSLSRRWHQPVRFPKPVLESDRLWDRWCPVVYGSVLRWRGKFRMWSL